MVATNRTHHLSFENAAERKSAKYVELVDRAQNAGYKSPLVTLEVGSRGIVSLQGFACLQKVHDIRGRELKSLLQNISKEAIIHIWCQRNSQI